MEQDRRSEARIRSKGHVVLITEDERGIQATLCDVSASGMRVEALEELPSGVPVRIDVHGFNAFGVVRSCVRKDDKYQIGVKLLPHSTSEA